MGEITNEPFEIRAFRWLEMHWKFVTLASWLILSAWFVLPRLDAIRSFGLGDTDDNMRMMQVRALLHGQDWFDLRQLRLAGSNIHWSRLVDLPIASLIVGLRAFLGEAAAERWAAAIAPLLPYLLLLVSVALTVRRLVHPSAYPLAFLALFFAVFTNGMFLPERIDHHGWQLALLALAVAAIADPKRLRGGITLGAATGLSLAIGLEMLVYLAMAGIAMALFWVVDRDERDRLTGYAVTLAAGTTFAYLIFASYANRGPVCDALSAVWLTDALLGSALLFGLARLSPSEREVRLASAAVAGIIVFGFHAFIFPSCMQRLEGVSPDVDRLWLSHVREAQPVYIFGWEMSALTLMLPGIGAVGWVLLAWSCRKHPEHLRRVIATAGIASAATLLLFWQMRTAPAAQMLAATGCAAMIWILVPRTWNSALMVVRVLGTSGLVLIGIGAPVLALNYLPASKKDGASERTAAAPANSSCNALQDFAAIGAQPKGVVFTFIDLAPRLITVTHHDSVTGPYHRNGQQIADVMKAFLGSEQQAHALISKYHSDYVLTCPSLGNTISKTPVGFYAQLQSDHLPRWLSPIALPKGSPFRMWRVKKYPDVLGIAHGG